MTRKSPYVVLLAILMFAGCGTSPPVNYYGLDTLDISYTQDKEGSPVLVLGPFRMPEYLNRSQMIMRGSGAEMIVDDGSRWVEPLDDSIHRILASNLDSLLESVVVVGYPTTALLEVNYRLVGRIGSFSSGQDGLIILEVQWGMANVEGGMLVVPRRSRYESQAAIPGDPGSVALAMSDALGQFSRDIASEIESGGFDKTD